MADEESQAGSPPVVVPNSIEQSLRDHFERILLISEVAAASLAEQVMEVFTEKEEQLTGRRPGRRGLPPPPDASLPSAHEVQSVLEPT